MVISPNSPWNNALSLIRANVSEQVYNTWFKKIGFESYDDKTKTVILQVPSHFVCEYLEENYVGLLGKALRQNFCPEVGLKYRLVAEKEVVAVEAEPQTTIRVLTLQRRPMRQQHSLTRQHSPSLSTLS